MHPGGPFWKRKDEGAWSIPKGEIDGSSDRVSVALREFQEELGEPPPNADLASLGSVRQAGGKVVEAWAARGDFDVNRLHSNTFELEWPPRSGKMEQFPEVDRAAWFDLEAAHRKILPAQQEFLTRLAEMVSR